MDNTAERAERRAALAERTGQLRRIIEIRRFEDRVRDLFAEGKIHGTTHTCHGQEAVAVAVARALRPTDTVTCTYRGHGHALALGMTPREVLGEIAGRTIGCMGGLGGSMHLSAPDVGLLPTFAIVGAGIPVAAGAAYACEVLGTDDIAVSLFGDGATNIGAFHEGLNLAAIWKLPVLFVCENNVYGEYSRINLTTPVEDLAVRAGSYAMASRVIDGQDADVAVAEIQAAVDEVRQTRAPMFVEMKTYRFAGHSRADQAEYRPAGELEQWMQRDPITILGTRLIEEGVLDQAAFDALRDEVERDLESVIDDVLAAPVPDPSAMFEHVYAP